MWLQKAVEQHYEQYYQYRDAKARTALQCSTWVWIYAFAPFTSTQSTIQTQSEAYEANVTLVSLHTFKHPIKVPTTLEQRHTTNLDINQRQAKHGASRNI